MNEDIVNNIKSANMIVRLIQENYGMFVKECIFLSYIQTQKHRNKFILYIKNKLNKQNTRTWNWYIENS